MTLRIERLGARIRLSGDFRSEHVDQLKAEVELCELPAVLDLEELDLVDIEGVRFLNGCEAKGISVVHCSPYIREWMSRERRQRETSSDKRKKGQISSKDEQVGHE